MVITRDTFKDSIDSLIIELGITKQELASMLGIGVTELQLLLIGNKLPTRGHINTLTYLFKTIYPKVYFNDSVYYYPKVHHVIANGVEYRSIKDACIATGLSKKDIQNKIGNPKFKEFSRPNMCQLKYTTKGIKKIMSDIGLTQVAVARAIGVSPASINRFFEGKKELSEREARLLSLIINKPFGSVFSIRYIA